MFYLPKMEVVVWLIVKFSRYISTRLCSTYHKWIWLFGQRHQCTCIYTFKHTHEHTSIKQNLCVAEMRKSQCEKCRFKFILVDESVVVCVRQFIKLRMTHLHCIYNPQRTHQKVSTTIPTYSKFLNDLRNHITCFSRQNLAQNKRLVFK